MNNNQAILAEITRASMQSKGEVCLRLNGNCMWPVLRDKDIVTITKASYGTLLFGDIAVFQTTAGTFHANILFRTPEKGFIPENYLGKVIRIERNRKISDPEARSAWEKWAGVLLCPSNPYGLGLPAYLFKKLGRSFKSQK